MSGTDCNNLPALRRIHRKSAAAAVLATVSAALFAPFAYAQTVPAESGRIARGTPLTLTTRDAIELALKSNLDIRIERYSLVIDRIRFRGARGAYDPQATLLTSSGSLASLATSLLQAGVDTRLIDTTRVFSTGIKQNLWTGGSWSATLAETRSATNDPYQFVNPVYGGALDFRLEQPLLRGLKIDETRRQLRVLNLNIKIGDAQFRQAVAELVLRVLEQYWNLEYAREAVAAREESRDLAANQRNQIQQKVQAGLLTPIALASANAEVALREQDIIQSEVQVVSSENLLKQLMADDPRSDIWRRTLVPSEKPMLREPPQSIDAAIEEALRNRPELENLDLQVRQNQVDREFYKSETLPQANVVATLGSIGRAGTVYTPLYDNSGNFVPVGRQLNTADSGYGGVGKSLGQLLAFSYPNWSLGLNVQFPIGNRSAKAQMAEAEVSHARIETQIKRQQQAIVVEVSTAFESMMLQRKAMEVARIARELSQEQVKGQMARFEAGFTTNFEVLRYQRDLADARLQELRAMVDYEVALASLKKATAQIIDDNDLVIARTQR
jgi:HAE1 family hydrophobic/amphiphilic exporter-1